MLSHRQCDGQMYTKFWPYSVNWGHETLYSGYEITSRTQDIILWAWLTISQAPYIISWSWMLSRRPCDGQIYKYFWCILRTQDYLLSLVLSRRQYDGQMYTTFWPYSVYWGHKTLYSGYENSKDTRHYLTSLAYYLTDSLYYLVSSVLSHSLCAGQMCTLLTFGRHKI